MEEIELEGIDKDSLKSFISSYESQFKDYNKYILDTANSFSEFQQEEFYLQRDMVAILLDRLKFLKRNYNAYLDLKYVKNFGTLLESTSNHFISTCEHYIKTNKWLNIKDTKMRANSIKFQGDVVNSIAKFRDILTKYSLEKEELIDATIPIEGDKIVPLMMKDIITDLFPKVNKLEQINNIASHISTYDINSSKEFFKNIKNPPPYDRSKNFWEQGKDTIDFYLNEKDKIINGINISGVHISGMLYWHCNFFKTILPVESLKGRLEYNPQFQNIIATPNLRDNELFFDYFYKKAESEGKGLFLFGTRRFAKALHNDESLVYSDGSLRPIGEAIVGDEIIGRDGKVTKIIGVYPQGKKELYHIKFSDGRKIRCCKDHIWTVDIIDKNKKSRKTIDTRELIIRNAKQDIYLPDIDIVHYWHTKKTDFEPYLLGAWTFIGSSVNKGVIFNLIGKEEHWNDIKYSCRVFGVKYTEDKDRLQIRIDDRGKSASILCKLGLSEFKQVPNSLFTWVLPDKIQYIRGIMDFVKKRESKGNIILEGLSDKMKEGLKRLFRELSLYVNETTGNLVISKAQYKTLKHNGFKSKVIKTAKVVSIEPIGSDYATCIQVDNKDKLFLTTDFIPTHNTTIEGSLLTRYSTVFPLSKNLVIGGSDTDLKNLSDVLETAFLNINPAFLLPRNNNDWNKHIQFGLKHKSGERIPYSDIYIRNVNSGKGGGELKVAGSTPDSWIVDEVGKFDISPVYEQARPSFDTPYGLRLVPVLVGCLTEDNWIFDIQGRPTKIKELLSTPDVKVSGWNGRNCSVEPVIHKNPIVKKKCIKITLENGIETSCSVDHPFLKLKAFKEYKFRKNKISTGITHSAEAKNISVGDKIMCPDFFSFSNRTIRNFYKGGEEDYLSKGVMDVISGSETFGDNILAISNTMIAKLFGKLFKVVGKGYFYGKDVYTWKFSNKSLAREGLWLLMKIGVHCRIIEKEGFILETMTEVDAIRAYNKIIKNTGLIDKSLLTDEEEYKRLDKKQQNSVYYFEYNNANKKGEFFKDTTNSLIKNIRPIKVVKVEDIGVKEVINFTTSVTHTYIANGLITFNTGGNAEFSHSAQDMLTNPDAYNLVNMDWDYLDKMVGDSIDKPYKRRNFGVFVPAHLSYKKGILKDKSNLSEYYNIDDSRLKKIDLEVTNWKRAEEVINKDRESKKNVVETLNQEKMGYPIDPMECFLANNDTPFTCIPEAIQLRDQLKSDGDVGLYVDLYRTPDGTVKYRETDKRVPEFPFKGGNFSGAVVLFEKFPDLGKFDGTYCAGLDHYKHTKAGTSSVGSLYVFKRRVNLNDLWSDRFVCSYASRPDTMKEFNRNCEMILDAYGSQVLQENADISFQQFLSEKNREEFLLARGDEIVNNMIKSGGFSSQNNKFGLNPSVRNKDYLMKLFAHYCNCHLDEEGGEYEDITRGVQRIPDPYLLDEIIGFSYGVNVDRITSASHALAWARYLDKIGVIPDVDTKNDDYELNKKKKLMKMRRLVSYRGVRANAKRKILRRNKIKSTSNDGVM